MGNYRDIVIDNVVDYCGLEKDPRSNLHSSNYYVKCPYCDDHGHHMNVDRKKNYFHCVLCGHGGGTMHLFAELVLHTSLTVENRKYVSRKMHEVFNGVQYKASEYKYDQSVAVKDEIEKASDTILNNTFSCILSFPYFSLTEEHRQNLLNRGLDEETIRNNGYRSIDYKCQWTYEKEFQSFWKKFDDLKIDAERKKYEKLKDKSKKQIVAGMILADWLQKQGCQLEGVPGFFKLKDIWFFNMYSGLLIPTRNIKGQIVTFQLRTASKTVKYITLSARDLPYGVSQHITRIHFPISNPPLTHKTNIFVTEGPLKSDVAQHLMGGNNFFIALHGVNNQKFVPELFNFLNSCGIKKIYNAFDMDRIVNKNVAASSYVLNKVAREAGINVTNYFWDADYCKELYEQLLAECTMHNAQVQFQSENLFCRTAQLAVCLSDLGEKDLLKWNPNTKGIDDYLQSQM